MFFDFLFHFDFIITLSTPEWGRGTHHTQEAVDSTVYLFKK